MIILDTHIWIWWINGDYSAIGTARCNSIEQSDTVAVSTVSFFEVAWLDRHGRIKLQTTRKDFFDKALNESGIKVLPLTPQIAEIAVDLPEHHRDPMDRIIIATTMVHDAYLMSDDGKFKYYAELKSKLL